MKSIPVIILIPLLLNFHWLSAEEVTASFESRLFSYLNVAPMQRIFVVDFIDCSFACLRNVLCFSINVAVFAGDRGRRWCELLPSNVHNDAAKLTENQQSHHYSLIWKNPCASVTCVNGGECKVVSLRHGTYEWVDVCHPGYLGTRCEIAPKECKHYTVLSEPDRHPSYGRGNESDSSLIPGWYRFQSSHYTKMADTCISHYSCFTDITGWLNGTHPSLEDGIVTREVCFHGYYDCCHMRVQILVRECDGFYVYELKPSPAGYFRYCAAS